VKPKDEVGLRKKIIKRKKLNDNGLENGRKPKKPIDPE